MLVRLSPPHLPPFLLLLTFAGLLGTSGVTPARGQFLELKINSGDPGVRDRLGESAAIDGTTALVGAFRDDEAGLDAGAAYIFRFEDGTWIQEIKLLPSGPPFDGDPLAGDLFGSVVALSGDVAVVGAPESRPNGIRSGAAYVFERDPNGSGWKFISRLTAFDAASEDKYGATVATNGEFVFVGALDDDDLGINSGSLYIYQRGPVGWVLSQKMLASDGLQGDSFGWYVAVDGDRAVVGARDVDAVAVNAGAAYVLENQGGIWVETARLLPSDGAADDSFGEVVAIHGDRIAVGARDADAGKGAAYIYENSPSGWIEAARLVASDGVVGDLYGHAVAIYGDRAFVTTRNDNDRRGAAYLYERIEGVWSETAKLAPRDLAFDDQYGQAVGIGERYAVVTAKQKDQPVEDAGVAYFYDLFNTDRGALLALYDATNGPGWTTNEGWDTSTPLGTWKGVETDEEGFVTGLFLHNNGLIGPLPAEIGSLQRIDILDLFENTLSGPLPPELGQLSTLRELRLYTNQFTGTLPPELGQLVQLEHLALGANQFTGSIPSEYGGMTALREFYIPSNRLDGVVPAEIAGLPNLEIFRAAFNSLTELPDFSAAAGRMTSLRVHTNRFTFEDLEPNVGISGFEYIPQADFGEAQSISIDEGQPLVVEIPIGGVNNRYQWWKDGVVIPGAENPVYDVVAATTDDSGVYTLEVTNDVVAGLTLNSLPVVVEVSNAERYDAFLHSLNVLPPFNSPASGELTAERSGNTVIVTGSFEDMVNPYTGAALYVGAPDVNGIQIATLNASLVGSGGLFEADRNSFSLSNPQLDALSNGQLYAVIFTNRPDAQGAVQVELRGQFYFRPNLAPFPAVLVEPADGTRIDLSQEGTLDVSWTSEGDPDGHPAFFLWSFSRTENFAVVDAIFRTETRTDFSLSYAALDAFLASKGVPPGGSATLYHLIATTDGSLITLSERRALTLSRSINNAPPFVNSAIGDRIHAEGDPPLRIDLRAVFADPEEDPLQFAASSDNTSTGAVVVSLDTLVVSAGALGTATITVTAEDSRGGVAEDVFLFTVNAGPRVDSPIADQELVENGAAFTIALSSVFSDADPLTYSASSDNGSVASASVEVDGETLTVTPIAQGSATVVIVATDDKLASASDTFAVAVEEARITPPLTVVEAVNVAFGDPTIATSYRLVGLPGDVALPMGQAIPGTVDEDWVAYRDRGDPDAVGDAQFQKYDGTALFDFRPGRGFWLLATQAWSRAETRPTVALDAEDAYDIPLQPGWNILSNPFDIDVNWSDVQTRNGIDASLFAWNGAFSSSATFASARTGRGYYFLNADDRPTLSLPYVPAGPPGAAPPPRGLSLTVQAIDGPASVIVAGIRPRDAERSGDQPAPPRQFEKTSLRLLRAGAPSPSRRDELIEEYHPEHPEGYRYTLSLHAEEGQSVTVTLADVEHFAGSRAVLVDDRLGKPYTLDPAAPLKLTPPAARTNWTLLVGTESYLAREMAEIAPAEVILTQNYPNPFSSGTIIEYALPEPTRVRLVVYDILGRLVQILVDGERDAGFHSVRWDGTAGGPSSVRSGLYLYRLEAGGVYVARTMTVAR